MVAIEVPWYRAHVRVKGAPVLSDRKFGWQFGIGLAMLSLIGVWRGWWPWLVISLAFLALTNFTLAWVAPSALGTVNRAWMGLGHLLGKLVAPIVLSLMFVVLFVPIAAVMRLWGRDELLLRDRSGDSFWVKRPEPVVTAASFRNQY